VHIIDDIGQPDPHGGSGDAYSSYEQPCLRFLIDKNMLDAGSDHGFSTVGPLNMPKHRLEMRLFPVDPRDTALLFHEVLIRFRAIGCVGPNRRGGIGFIQQALSQSYAIAGSGICCLPFADQPIFPINGDMRLVAKERDGEIRGRDRPVLLPSGLVNFSVYRA
jgi:hypothetical protein